MIEQRYPILKSIFKLTKEVAVIVIGVSISFFVDKCKNDRQDRESLALLYQNLRLDLQRDSAQLAMMCAGAEAAKNSTALLYENIDHPELVLDSLPKAVRLLRYSSVFVPTNITYEEIKQNGLSKLIKDSKIKRNLYDLYANYYEDLHVVNKKVSDLVDEEISPFMNQNLPYTYGRSEPLFYKNALAKAVRQNNTFRNLIKRGQIDKAMSFTYYKTTYEKVGGLLAILPR